MSASAEAQLTEKEVMINGNSYAEKLSTIESEPEPKCADEKNAMLDATETESLADWFVMVCVFLMNFLNGINYAAYGVLYLPMTETFESSRAAVGWVQSFDFALGTFLGIFISHPVNVFGCRLPAAVGSLLIAVGGILSCLSPSLIWMYFLKGIIPGIGQSMALLTCNVIIQQRFNKHRSLATGISVMGWSVGNFTGAPLTELLLNLYGLRGALALLGAIQSHRIPLALQFKTPQRFRTASNRPKLSETASLDRRSTCDKFKHYIQGSLDFTLLRKTAFLLFCITGVLQKFIVNCYIPHIVNWAIADGVRRNLAVWAVSALSCSTTICRIFVALIADRKCVNRLIIYACGLFMEFLMCFPPLVYPGIIGTYLSVILFGFHAGCTHTLATVVLVDLQGVENIARCFALHAAFVSFALLTGSPFMGFVYDVTGSYKVGFIILICVAIVAFSIMITIYIIDRHAKSRTKTNAMAVIDESEPTDTKC